ncbi:unnamed protein product, partial [marine sediment metagenome]
INCYFTKSRSLFFPVYVWVFVAYRDKNVERAHSGWRKTGISD